MRLIIISNSMPLTVTRLNDYFDYEKTSNGLVTGLLTLKQYIPFLWLGKVSGLQLTEVEKIKITKDYWTIYKSIPVFIDNNLNKLAYDGFSNSILWPLLHSFTDPVKFNQKYYDGYKLYNNIFCNKICKTAKDGDVIWVHDYQFMLLPMMLRQNIKKKVKIAFFLHIPFPSVDVFTTLPVASDIINGIIGADHIAFHVFDYLGNFLTNCHHLLPQKSDFCKKANNDFVNYYTGTVDLDFRKITFNAIPVGIDPSNYVRCLAKKETKERIAALIKTFKNKNIFIGVDRTDFIKGIPNRIKGFKRFLKKNDMRNVVFLQVAVPSKIEIFEHQALIYTINELITEVNSKVGKIDGNLIYMLNSSVTFVELCALYAVADAGIVTSLNDGMNLVALEFIACQKKKKSVLILSEFAGCASTLPGAVFCNPWNEESVADGIYSAMTMNEKEKKERWEINWKNVEKFTAHKWAEENLKHLKD